MSDVTHCGGRFLESVHNHVLLKNSGLKRESMEGKLAKLEWCYCPVK